ncbi:DUF4190 domain-containing protein [Leucobacter albus]|uniref:DUF4190 domain-containing protein n=1 Tax=Leucobacter albus TaxID=272210 RepID=A0ABW3TQK3_9MICO
MNRAVLVSGAWIACIVTVAFLVHGAFRWMYDPIAPPLIAFSAYVFEFGFGIALLIIALKRRRTAGVVFAGTAIYILLFALTQSPLYWYYGSFLAQPLMDFPYLAQYCFVAICLAAAYQLSPPNPEVRALAEERRTARIVQHQAAQLQVQQRAQQLVAQQHGVAPSLAGSASVALGAQPTAPAFTPAALPQATSNGLAVAAIIAVWFSSVAGLVLGAIALRQIRVTGQSGRGMALTAVIVGSIVTGLSIVLAIVYFVAILSAFSAF